LYIEEVKAKLIIPEKHCVEAPMAGSMRPVGGGCQRGKNHGFLRGKWDFSMNFVVFVGADGVCKGADGDFKGAGSV
jgi:hypothetical protein